MRIDGNGALVQDGPQFAQGGSHLDMLIFDVDTGVTWGKPSLVSPAGDVVMQRPTGHNEWYRFDPGDSISFTVCDQDQSLVFSSDKGPIYVNSTTIHSADGKVKNWFGKHEPSGDFLNAMTADKYLNWQRNAWQVTARCLADNTVIGFFYGIVDMGKNIDPHRFVTNDAFITMGRFVIVKEPWVGMGSWRGEDGWLNRRGYRTP